MGGPTQTVTVPITGEKPTLAGYADHWLGTAEDDWAIRALEQWDETENVTARAARLREFCQRRDRSALDVAIAAGYKDGSVVSQWANKKLGERRYISPQSATSRKIEDVLSGKKVL